MRRTRGLLFFILALILVFSGCSSKDKKDDKKQSNKAATATKKESKTALNKRLADGKLGSDSMAFIGGGVSGKTWVADAKYHKLVSMIDWIGPNKPERTKKLYPDLSDTHAIVFTKDFKTGLVLDWFSYDEPSTVIAFDPVTFKEKWRAPAGTGGHHSALSPDDKYLYVANEHGGNISVIDMQTHKKIKDLTTGKGPDYITPSMYWNGTPINSPYLFASIDQENKVSVIDWKTNTIVKEIPVAGMMHGVNLTPDGKQAWVCVMGAKHVAIIDVATLQIIDKIPFKESPIHLSFSPNGKYAYITVGGSKNQIFKVSTAKGYKKLWNSTGTSVPAHTGVSPDGKELWTLNHGMDPERYPYNLGGNTLSGVQIWDTDNGNLVAEIPAEGMPHEIQFVPYSAVGAIPPQSHPEDSKGKAGENPHGAHADPDSQANSIYQRSCVACHASDLSGKDGPNLQHVGSRMTEEQLYTQIKNGKGMMPSGLVTDEEAKLLAAWLVKRK